MGGGEHGEAPDGGSDVVTGGDGGDGGDVGY